MQWLSETMQNESLRALLIQIQYNLACWQRVRHWPSGASASFLLYNMTSPIDDQVIALLFSSPAFPRGLLRQQLQIKLPYLSISQPRLHFAWMKFQMVPTG